MVLSPTVVELAKHEAVLEDIDKSNKGKPCVWRMEDIAEVTEAKEVT